MNAPAKFAELTVDGLSVRSKGEPIVSDVAFSLSPGKPLTLLGESGSGKSLVAHAIMGSLPAELSVAGSITFDGVELLAERPDARRRRWGREIALLPQEPWLALDPTMRVAPQVAEVHRFVHSRPWALSAELARDNLTEVGLGHAGDHYPFQMSGGMCQRAAIAITHAAQGKLLIADEPTKGLDAQLRDNVVQRLKHEVEAGRLLLTITHDIAVARALGGIIGVMFEGRLIDYGPAEQVLSNPSHTYTRALIAADPESWDTWTPSFKGDVALSGRGLAKAFGERALFSDLDIEARGGEIVSIVGPSGCGKTTVGNILLGLIQPDAGRIERRSGIARQRFQKLYQDPPAAFAPGQSIGEGLADLARLHGRSWADAENLLGRLRLNPKLLGRVPGQLSGGELQRFAILRALLLDPVFLFADEATSRLDPVSQKEVIDLLKDIVGETGLAVLLVTHDLALAKKVSSRVIGFEGAGTGNRIDPVDAPAEAAS